MYILDKMSHNRRGWLPTPPPQTQVTYESLLSSMGVHVTENGQLQAQAQTNNNQLQPQTNNNNNDPQLNAFNKHSYIYNKYFKDEQPDIEPAVRRPQTLREYRDMLLADHLQRQRIKQVKSTKLFLFK